MTSIHTPERAANESQVEYRARRRDSRLAVDAMKARTSTGGRSAREQHRAAMKQSGSMAKHAGAYGRFLTDWVTGKQLSVLKFGA